MYRVAVLSLLSILNFLPCKAKGNDGFSGKGLQFITNKGQVTDQDYQPRTDIDAKIEQGGVTMFVGDGQLHYQWTKSLSPALPQGERIVSESKQNNMQDIASPMEGGLEGAVSIYRMDVVLLGANKNAEVVFEEPTGYYENYYTEYTGEAGVQAMGYGKIIYKDIWSGIDWVLYVTSPNPSEGGELSLSPLGRAGEGSVVKYDFIIHPGADVNDIQLRYEGTTTLKIKDGALTATTPYGSITEAAPYSYEAESRATVATKYVLDGNTLSFETSDHEGALVIDPQLVWATYYGGMDTDEGYSGLSLSTDLLENVYLASYTSSTSNIATSGAHQSTLAGFDDAYLTKFDSSGQRLWGTYFGVSNGMDLFKSIMCDKFGNIYGVGVCDSCVGITTSGAHQTTFGGPYSKPSDYNDAFLVKFDSTGNRIWTTLYGGTGYDILFTIDCDENSNIFIAGATTSDTGIATNGTHKSSHASKDGWDGFVAKFDSSGTRLWGTYYGGDTSNNSFSDDYIYNITSAPDGYLYAGGATKCENGIASNGSHQSSKNSVSNQPDGFFTKLNATNGKRAWGTYYGGVRHDVVRCLITDDSNQVYIAGASRSDTGIATNNGVYKNWKWSASGSFPAEVFLAKFDSSGQRLWGTYYGGTNVDYPTGITIGTDNNIHILGVTWNTASISTPNSHQPTQGGGNTDYFWATFNPSAQLKYATFYGGVGHDYPIGSFDHNNYMQTQCISGTNSGRIFFTGSTNSNNNIATQGSHQDTLASSSNRDVFLAAFDIDTVVYIPQAYTDTSWCPGDTVRIVYGVNMPFHNGNSFTVQLSDSNGNFANAVSIGTRTDSVSDTITCVVPLGTPAANGYRIRILADSPNRTSWDNQWDIRIKETPASFSQTTNTPVCTRDTLHLTGASTSSGVNWAWSGPNSFGASQKDTFITNAQLSDSGQYVLTATLNSTGCSLRDTVEVEMRTTPDTPTASSNSPVCETFALNLTAGTNTNGVSWSWTGPGSYSSSTQNPSVTSNASSTHAGNYIATATLNGCSSTDTTNVVVLAKPSKPTASTTNSPLCQYQDLQLTASNINGASYNWYGPSLFTATTQNPTRYSMTFTDSGYYYVYATISGCASDTDSVRVVVNTDPVVNIFPSPGNTICQGEEATFTAVPTNAGTATYSWTVNYISTGTTGTTYKTSSLTNGDVVRCEMISTGTCATPFTDTSNGITMTVNDTKAPTVAISATPNHSLYPNEPVSFTATPTNGGNNPTYQWLRNGSPIGGAQSAVWGANANFLSDGDDICVVLFSDYVCPDPDTALSNCIPIQIRLNVDDLSKRSDVTVYPNPTNSTVTIEGITAGTVIELYDLVGKKLINKVSESNTEKIQLKHLASGMYLLYLTKEDGHKTSVKVRRE